MKKVKNKQRSAPSNKKKQTAKKTTTQSGAKKNKKENQEKIKRTPFELTFSHTDTEPIKVLDRDSQAVLQYFLKAHEDTMRIRITNYNRIGLKSDGTRQDRVNAPVSIPAWGYHLKFIADANWAYQDEIKKIIMKMISELPIYTEFLSKIEGLKTSVYPAYLIGYINIHQATHGSKLTQFTGMNSGLVKGVKDVAKKNYRPKMGEIKKEYVAMSNGEKRIRYITNEDIRGDKPTAGFCLPYCARLKSVLLKIIADAFIITRTPKYRNVYDDRKHRTTHSSKLHHYDQVPWKDTTPGHRDNDARRVMMKQFIWDLYETWRELEGLPVRPRFQEEKLGHKHGSFGETPNDHTSEEDHELEILQAAKLDNNESLTSSMDDI